MEEPHPVKSGKKADQTPDEQQQHFKEAEARVGQLNDD
jgi:hypothetical protein